MKKIAIIGANDFQKPLVIKAKELGYQTHVFAWEEGATAKEYADYFYPISITEKEKILLICREIKIDAIISIGSDLVTNTINYVAMEMGLPGNTLACTEKATNKYKMREAFKKNNIPVPNFIKFSEGDNIDNLNFMKLPIIVKPTDRSGSRSITKINCFKELEPAINDAINSSFEKGCIIEEFIEGEEYSLEGISFEGKHYFLAITKKYTTGAPNFIETGHLEPAELSSEMIDKIYKFIPDALNALEIKNSATHTEFKITPEGEIRIIEIGARMGGDCIGSNLVQISTGYDYLKMVLDVSLGKFPDFNKITEPKNAMIKFVFDQKDIENLEKIKKEYPNTINYISNIHPINSHIVSDSSTRFGFYILQCSEEEKSKLKWILEF